MFIMSRIKFAVILFSVFLPSLVFSQSLKVKELYPFMLINNGEYTKSLNSLDLLIEENPNVEFYLAKVKALYMLEKYNDALIYCYKIDKEKPAYSSKYKIKIFLELDDKENLELALKENLKSKYKISLYDLLNSKELAGLQSYDITKEILSGNKTYSNIEKQLYQAEKLLRNEKYTQALFVVDEVLSRNKNISEAYFLQSKISYYIGDFKKSKESINKAIELKRSKAEYYLQKAKVNIELRNYEDALEDVNRLIRKEIFNIDNYILKLNVLVKTSSFDEAVELSNSLLEILPKNSEILFLNSKSLFEKGDNFAALKSINKAMEIKTSKQAFELRGDIYMATNTFKYAVSDYSMFLDIDPYNGYVYAKKGFARLKLGDKKGACSDWRKAKRYGSYDAVRYLEKYCE